MKSNQERRLMIIGGYGYNVGEMRAEVQYMRLSDNTVHWGNALPYGHQFARFVSIDPYRGFLVGGKFAWPGQSVL